jgi:serine protease Do
MGELVDQVGDSIALIKTPQGSLGSGLVISEEGHILTNYHVIEDNTQLTVTLYFKSQKGFAPKVFKDVKIIALHPVRDLAIIKINDEDLKETTLKPVTFAGGGEPRQGDSVFIIGSPLGLERTVTQGVVSSMTRNMGNLRFIQTDAAINGGNSGGPIFNSRAEVVGVVSAGINADGLGFGIPLDDALHFLNHPDAFRFNEELANNGILYHKPPTLKKKTKNGDKK